MNLDRIFLYDGNLLDNEISKYKGFLLYFVFVFNYL